MNVDRQVSTGTWVVEQPFAPLTAAPWANGLGATTELVGYERSRSIRSELAAPEWRVSIAELREPAAFSPLPGVHRNFMPVGGDILLEVDGVRHEASSGTVLQFSGDADVRLVALSGPCHAVNLMSPHVSLQLRLHDVTSGAAAAVADPLSSTALPLAAVLLADRTTDAADADPALPARRFDLVVPRVGATASPPSPSAVIELL